MTTNDPCRKFPYAINHFVFYNSIHLWKPKNRKHKVDFVPSTCIPTHDCSCYSLVTGRMAIYSWLPFVN